MRLTEASDALLHVIRLQVNHFNRMIAGGRNEKPVAGFVDCKVVEFACNAG
jgi:hypothetical protein